MGNSPEQVAAHFLFLRFNLSLRALIVQLPVHLVQLPGVLFPADGILGLPLDQGSHRAGDDGNDQHADDRHGIAGHGHVELRVRVHEVIVDAESAEYGSGDAPQIAVRHPGNDEHSQCVDQCRVVLNARIAQQDVTDLVCCGQNKKCFKQI